MAKSFCLDLSLEDGGIPLEAVIGLFHRWIRERRNQETLIDVADYSHLADGPLVLLIGHARDYGLIRTDEGVWFRIREKRRTEPIDEHAVQLSLDALLSAASELEAALSVSAPGAFRLGDVLVLRLLDRWLEGQAPRAEVEAHLARILRASLGEAGSEREAFGRSSSDPREAAAARAGVDKALFAGRLMASGSGRVQ